jgi:hypothetical protein
LHLGEEETNMHLEHRTRWFARALLFNFALTLVAACDSEGTVLRPGESAGGTGGDSTASASDASVLPDGTVTDVDGNTNTEPVPEAVKLAAADPCFKHECGSGSCVVEGSYAVCKCPQGEAMGLIGSCLKCDLVKDKTVDLSVPKSVLPRVSVAINGVEVENYLQSNQFTLGNLDFATETAPPGNYKIIAKDHVAGKVSTVPLPSAGSPVGLPAEDIRINLRVMPVRILIDDTAGNRIDSKALAELRIVDDEGTPSDASLVGRHWAVYKGEVLGAFTVMPGDPLTVQDFGFKTNRQVKSKYTLAVTGVPPALLENAKVFVDGFSLPKATATSFSGTVFEDRKTVELQFEGNSKLNWSKSQAKGDTNDVVSIDLLPAVVTLDNQPWPQGCYAKIVEKENEGFVSSVLFSSGQIRFPLHPNLGQIAIESAGNCRIENTSVTETQFRSGKVNLSRMQDRIIETKLTIKINGQPAVGELGVRGTWAPGFMPPTPFVNGSIVKVVVGVSKLTGVSLGKDGWDVEQLLSDLPENNINLKLTHIKARVRSIWQNVFSSEIGFLEPFGHNIGENWQIARVRSFPTELTLGGASRAAPQLGFAEFDVPAGTYLFSSTSSITGSYGCFIVPAVP